MKFSEFTQYLPKILKEQLPAFNAHLKMAPADRKASLREGSFDLSTARPSAVMMLVYPKDGNAHLVLTKRNEYVGIHSSQISFPGGKAEPADKDLMHTAIRETVEEIGITINEIDILMPFSKLFIPPSNFIVYPFLAISNTTPDFRPDPYEVHQIIELPLERLLDDSIMADVELDTSYATRITVPAFIVDEHVVWGATAMILSELKETIKCALH